MTFLLKILIAVSLISISALADKVKLKNLNTKDGESYKSVTVREVTPANIRIFHSAGAAVIPFEQLPEDVQEQLGGFDAEKAKKYREEQAKKQKKTDRANAAYHMRQAKLKKAKEAAASAKDKIKNAKKYWLIGKVQRVHSLGTRVLPASAANRSWISPRLSVGVGETKLAERKLNNERRNLPRELQTYLAKNGTFFGSEVGRSYIAKNWIKSPEDYEKYFSLEALYNNFQLVESLGVYPLFTQDAPVIIKTKEPLDVVDGEFVSYWVIAGEAHKTPDGRTLKSFSLFQKE